MSLARACLGCGVLVRGASRCPRCKAERERAKAARRPDLHNDAHERERRRRAVADHRARIGDWCPGVPELGRGQHAAANLSADHLLEVGAGGDPRGPLVVRCVPCNAARSAGVRRRVLAELGGSPHGDQPTTPRPSNFSTHTAADSPPPVVG
jgi:hypothetical protein